MDLTTKRKKQIMKNKIKHLIAGGVILLLAACQKDSSNADGDIRTDYIGTWKCVQNSKITGASEFTVSISKDTSNASRINIANFYKLGSNSKVYATVSTVAANTFDIPVQSVLSNYISGSGTEVNSTKLTFSYTVDDGNEVDSLTAVCTKL
jgi:hypothetical protein